MLAMLPLFLLALPAEGQVEPMPDSPVTLRYAFEEPLRYRLTHQYYKAKGAGVTLRQSFAATITICKERGDADGTVVLGCQVSDITLPEETKAVTTGPFAFQATITPTGRLERVETSVAPSQGSAALWAAIVQMAALRIFVPLAEEPVYPGMEWVAATPGPGVFAGPQAQLLRRGMVSSTMKWQWMDEIDFAGNRYLVLTAPPAPENPGPAIRGWALFDRPKGRVYRAAWTATFSDPATRTAVANIFTVQLLPGVPGVPGILRSSGDT